MPAEEHAPDFDPAFDVIEPIAVTTPIVFNSPHSGRIYPQRFIRMARLDALALRKSEDAFVDELFAPCRALGAPLLRAHFPRAWLDVNREAYELDPRMFEGRLPSFANTRSLRVAGGLGTIPRVVAESQEIYAAQLPVNEAMLRIEGVYKPYHRTLAHLVDRAARLFGVAALLDCHSMPSTASEGAPPDFVIGDRFGCSAASWLVDTIEGSLRARGYTVRRNKPYAGGFITEHYGAPGQGRHAVQIEINRALYMDERTFEKTARFRELAEALYAMGLALAERIRHEPLASPIAAE